MDSRKLAEEILDKLFANSQVLGEASKNGPEEEEEEDDDMEDQEEEDDDSMKEDEDEDEEEYEDDDEEEGDENEAAKSSSPQPQQSAAKPAPETGAPAASTINMKDSSSMRMQSMPTSGVEGSAVVSDALGGTARDTMGKGDILGTKQYTIQTPAVPQLAVPGGYVGSGMQEELAKDVRAMFEGAEDLSEEFVDKAVSLYGAAVISKVNRISAEINRQISEQFDNKLVEVADLLVNQIDHYMDYVVEEWMKENELAVESGIRTEIAENFISNLKKLFEESYIEVPAEKTDVFDELSEAIERLESRINEEMDTNTALIREIKSLKAEKVFSEETAVLSKLSAENVRSIAENVAFESEQDYRSKIRTLVEGYNKQDNNVLKTRSKKSKEEVLFESAILDAEEPVVEEEVKLPSQIRAYYDAIERTLPR